MTQSSERTHRTITQTMVVITTDAADPHHFALTRCKISRFETYEQSATGCGFDKTTWVESLLQASSALFVSLIIAEIWVVQSDDHGVGPALWTFCDLWVYLEQMFDAFNGSPKPHNLTSVDR